MTYITKQELEEKLSEEIEIFFPDDGTWYSNCFNKSKEVGYGNLPCHLRDNKWLTLLMIKKLNLGKDCYKDVYTYLLSSEKFQEKRHEYELEIVKWQIEFIPNGEFYMINEKYGGDWWKLSEDCDKAFRWSVKNTLEAIGMNSDVIEEGIEKNAGLWRDRYMERAFDNKYTPITILAPYLLGKEKNITPLPSVDKKFKEKWLELRKREYYLEHKNSVDNYGDKSSFVTFINQADLDYLNDMDRKRKKELEEYESQFRPKQDIYISPEQRHNKLKTRIKKLIKRKLNME